MKVVAYVTETQSQMIVNGNGASIPYPEKDLAVVNLAGMQTVYTETEPMGTVTARIFNYGANPVSNFDISYQLENGDVIFRRPLTDRLVHGVTQITRSALSLIPLHGNRINFTRSLSLLPLKMTRMFLIILIP